MYEVKVPLNGVEINRLLYWAHLNDIKCEEMRAQGIKVDKTDADALVAKLETFDKWFDKLPAGIAG